MLIGMDVMTYVDDGMNRSLGGLNFMLSLSGVVICQSNAAQFSYGFRSDFFSRKAHLLSSISRSLGCGVPACKIIWPYCFPDERPGTLKILHFIAARYDCAQGRDDSISMACSTCVTSLPGGFSGFCGSIFDPILHNQDK